MSTCHVVAECINYIVSFSRSNKDSCFSTKLYNLVNPYRCSIAIKKLIQPTIHHAARKRQSKTLKYSVGGQFICGSSKNEMKSFKRNKFITEIFD
jgi:hypothetical protein